MIVLFNVNSGYVGISRSVRSQEAIESYEVPISMINKTLVYDFLNDYEESFDKEDLDYLRTVSVGKWKYVARECTSPTSWHHTGSYFNRTNHYDLCDIATKILKMKDVLDKEYKSYKLTSKLTVNKGNIEYGVINVQVWGGSRKRPRIEGYEEVAGIIIGDWLFYKSNHAIKGVVNKYKTTANKVEWLKRYDSYAELVKNHKNYTGSKKVFDELIKDKGVLK